MIELANMQKSRVCNYVKKLKLSLLYRLPSPMNVVSLSFPSDKIGERHSMNR